MKKIKGHVAVRGGKHQGRCVGYQTRAHKYMTEKTSGGREGIKETRNRGQRGRDSVTSACFFFLGSSQND